MVSPCLAHQSPTSAQLVPRSRMEPAIWRSWQKALEICGSHHVCQFAENINPDVGLPAGIERDRVAAELNESDRSSTPNIRHQEDKGKRSVIQGCVLRDLLRCSFVATCRVSPQRKKCNMMKHACNIVSKGSFLD